MLERTPLRGLSHRLLCLALGASLLATASVVGCQRSTDAELALPRTPKVLGSHARETPWDRRGLGMPEGDATAQGVVLITVDTLRADRLSVYGGPAHSTPNLARLAAGSVLFRQAISQTTTTSPSHASIMTGLYLEDHNVYSNFEAIGDQPATLAKLLHAQGFATYGIVNMPHLNPEVVNLGRGFDVFERSGNQRGAGATFDHFLNWVEDIGDKRYFAWIHLADVHTPYRPPVPYDTLYYHGNPRDPSIKSLKAIWPLLPAEMAHHPLTHDWLGDMTDLNWVTAQYQGAVSYVDHEVGRLMDVLEQRQRLGKTAIIFTSDHGENLGEHGMYFVHMGLYESTVHIPLIAYFPGTGHHGLQVPDIVQSVDILPTILEYLNVGAPEHLRGESLWHVMRGNSAAPRTAFIEHAGRSQLALRSARYKYIRHLRSHHVQPSYPFVAGKEELYDLQVDPQEHKNIAQDHPEVIRTLRRQMQAHQAKKLDMQAGTASIDHETSEVLRSLGYVR